MDFLKAVKERPDVDTMGWKALRRQDPQAVKTDPKRNENVGGKVADPIWKG